MSEKLESLALSLYKTGVPLFKKQEVGDIADQLKKLIWKEDGTTDDHILIPALDGTTEYSECGCVTLRNRRGGMCLGTAGILVFYSKMAE
jgi:hypothetical protein